MYPAAAGGGSRQKTRFFAREHDRRGRMPDRSSEKHKRRPRFGGAAFEVRSRQHGVRWVLSGCPHRPGEVHV